MKPKNSKWIIYIVLFALFCAVFYLSIHKITPLSEHIEKDMTVSIR